MAVALLELLPAVLAVLAVLMVPVVPVAPVALAAPSFPEVVVVAAALQLQLQPVHTLQPNLPPSLALQLALRFPPAENEAKHAPPEAQVALAAAAVAAVLKSPATNPNPSKPTQWMCTRRSACSGEGTRLPPTTLHHMKTKLRSKDLA